MEGIDDLFDEPLHDPLQETIQAQLTLQAATTPALTGLGERIDELRSCGCCQRLDWSRPGNLVALTRDGRGIQTLTPQWNAAQKTWTHNTYLDPATQTSIANTFPIHRLVHVSWSPLGSDVVLVDAMGKMAIFSTVIMANRMNLAKVLAAEPEDTLNALVGLGWLSHRRTIATGRRAVKVDDRWNYDMASSDGQGPRNPWGRSAFLAVTRGGTLQLVYQDLESYHLVKTDLDDLSASGDLLTHASFCPDKDESVLLAVHTASKQVRLYTVVIDWRRPKNANEPSTQPPSLKKHHVTSIHRCAPQDSTVHDGPNNTTSMASLDLTHFCLCGRLLGNREQEQKSQPLLFTAFSPLPLHHPSAPLHRPPYQTVFQIWRLQEDVPVVDQSFSQLGSKKSPPRELKAETSLAPISTSSVDRLAIHLQLLAHGTTLAIIYSDGGVEHRRYPFDAALAMDEDDNRTNGLFSLGFYFNPQPCLYAALSLNSALIAHASRELDVKIAHAESPFDSNSSDADLSRTAAAWVMQNVASDTSLYIGHNTTDDLLLVLHHTLARLLPRQRALVEDLCLHDVYRNLGMSENLDDKSFEKVMRAAHLLRCLSFHLVCTFRSPGEALSLRHKLAWTIANLRHVSISFAYAMSPKQGPATPANEPEISKPEMLQFVAGLVGWAVMFFDYLFDQLFEMCRSLDIIEGLDPMELQSKAAETSNASVHLLLTSLGRAFLRHVHRAIRSVTSILQPLTKKPDSPLVPGTSSIYRVLHQASIRITGMEFLLESLEALTRKELGSLTEPDRHALESHIFLDASIPAAAVPVAQGLLRLVDRIRTTSGDVQSDLAFRNWTALGVEDYPRTNHDHDQQNAAFSGFGQQHNDPPGQPDTASTIDALQKFRLLPSQQLRRCTRCGAASEDLLPSKARFPFILALLRLCFCGGSWVLEPPPGEQ